VVASTMLLLDEIRPLTPSFGQSHAGTMPAQVGAKTAIGVLSCTWHFPVSSLLESSATMG